MKRLPLAFAALAFVLVPGAPALAQVKPDAKPVKVSFDLLKTKHMVVDVKLNGKGPYRVIFDTGAPISIINTKTAEEAGLVKKGTKPAFNPLGGGQVKIKTLEVGDLKAEDQPAVVMDHPTVKAISEALGPVEGIVGFPFFAKYKMTLDYQAKEMTFVPNGFEPPDVMEAMTAAITALMQNKKPPREVLAPAAQWGMVVAKAEGDDEAGVTVKEVLPGSAAAKAGLQAGDRLLTLDGRWTDSVADCFAAAGHVKPGAAVKLVIKRDGKEKELLAKPTSGL